jgi:hypothetical protein
MPVKFIGKSDYVKKHIDKILKEIEEKEETLDRSQS